MRILVVDDLEENRYLLKSLLTGGGYEVAAAVNGKTAMEELEKGAWDLVISDILMPVMDGYQLCRAIRSSDRLRHLPFVFFTSSYVDGQDEDFAMKLGADRFYRKPMDPRALLENIRKLLEEAAENRGRTRPEIPFSEGEVLKLHNERLVNNLEKKMRGLETEIAERKRIEKELLDSLEEKEVLLKEIHHRVKNNMQVISSLFHLQIRNTSNEECRGILVENETRVRSMSIVHEYLYRSLDLSKVDLASYIRSIADHLSSVYLKDRTRVRVETDLEEILLDINSAVPCGLLLNELISNALKHAFPEGRTGVVRIGMHRRPDGGVELSVADDGVGLSDAVDYHRAESMGLQIVNLLASQLDGTIAVDRTAGTAIVLTFREPKYKPRT